MGTQTFPKSRLTLYIGIALLAGIIVGFILNKNYVGKENEQIAFADLHLLQFQEAMNPYEKMKDSVGYYRLLSVQKNILIQKKMAAAQLLASADKPHTFSQIKLLSDSLNAVNAKLAWFTDTSNAIYQ